MSRRLYGRVVLKNDHWHINGEPHMILHLRRIIPRVGYAQEGDIELKDTDEARRYVLWFIDLFPLTVSREDLAKLQEGAKRHVNMLVRLDRLIDKKYKPSIVLMAVPPREYQILAAEMLLERGFLLLGDDVGLGKAQPLDSRILTPSGWRRFGDLKIGETIIDPDGSVSTITGVFPRGTKSVYRVTTSDGLSTECCQEHLWLVMTANDRKRGTHRVLPLQDFKDDLHRTYGKKVVKRHWYFLPVAQPALFNATAELPIKPYLLGALLGDGCFKEQAVGISKYDPDFIEKVRGELPNGVDLVYAGGCDWRISKKPELKKNPLLEVIRVLGLCGLKSYEKFIPKEYLLASVEDRKALLAGLMDTDGTFEKAGSTTYSSSSERLADDVRELIMSLGGFCTKTSRIPYYTYKGMRRNGKRSFTLIIRLPFNPFTLKRKADLWRQSPMARAIDSVVHVGEKETACISTNSKRQLYITDGYLVTHNTVSALCALTDPRTLPAIVVTLSGMMPLQWQRMTARFLPDLKTHVVTKGKPYELPRVDRRGPDVVILNYHKLDGWADTLAQYGRLIVFDEAQELRRSESLKYEAALRLSRAMRWRVGLSATPVFNYGGEIWNVLNVLQEDVLGTRQEFEREWCTNSTGRHSTVKDPKALGSYLRAEHLMLRRTRAEVGRELPELQRIPQFVESDEKALDSIKDSAAELARIILTREKTDGWDRLRAHEQFSMVVRQATGIAKAPHVADFVRILVDNGEPVVVYAWHREVYGLLQAKLADLDPVLFTGSETPEQKEEARKKFMAGETKVILMSLRAGQGVDGFQDICRTVVFAELDWSPGVHHQCLGRVHRDGQKDPVVAYFLVSDRGSDPTIAEKLGLKTAQAEGIRNPDADIIEEIQTDENRILDLARGYLERIGRKDLIGEKAVTKVTP